MYVVTGKTSKPILTDGGRLFDENVRITTVVGLSTPWSRLLMRFVSVTPWDDSSDSMSFSVRLVEIRFMTPFVGG